MARKAGAKQIPATPLGKLYDALCALTAHERTALAEAHAKAPWLLRDRFVRSVKMVQERPPTRETFYDSSRKAPPSPPTALTKTNSTIKFASHLCDGEPRQVSGAGSLRFRYIDREIFPARTTADLKAKPRRLDLLLANAADARPVFGELKIGPDKDAYFALVQGLMHASEFQSLSQRQRLKSHLAGDNFEWLDDGPFADIYIIAFKSPVTGKYRGRSFDASCEIARRLIDDEGFCRYVRRIAYLDAVTKNKQLTFEMRFAFGRSV